MSDRPCYRYFGSDGTLCAQHHGRFASAQENRCDRAATVSDPTTQDEKCPTCGRMDSEHDFGELIACVYQVPPLAEARKVQTRIVYRISRAAVEADGE